MTETIKKMTWGGFKKRVESNGITDDWVIDFIDIQPFSDDSLNGESVRKDEKSHEFVVSDQGEIENMKVKKGLQTPDFHCLISGHNGIAKGEDFEQTHEKCPQAKQIYDVTTAYYERIGWRVVASDGCQWNFH